MCWAGFIIAAAVFILNLSCPYALYQLSALSSRSPVLSVMYPSLCSNSKALVIFRSYHDNIKLHGNFGATGNDSDSECVPILDYSSPSGQPWQSMRLRKMMRDASNSFINFGRTLKTRTVAKAKDPFVQAAIYSSFCYFVADFLTQVTKLQVSYWLQK